jgi:hypothetical protein
MTKTKKGAKVGVLDKWCTKGERKWVKRETSRLRRRLGKKLHDDSRLRALTCGWVS